MGMFDTLTCDFPLPGGVPLDLRSLEFQTKDFECLLEKYHITPGGTLIKIGKDYTESINYTGEVYFYTSNLAAAYQSNMYTKGGVDHYWVEYKAVFENGKVSRMEFVEYKSEPAKDIKEMWK